MGVFWCGVFGTKVENLLREDTLAHDFNFENLEFWQVKGYNDGC